MIQVGHRRRQVFLDSIRFVRSTVQKPQSSSNTWKKYRTKTFFNTTSDVPLLPEKLIFFHQNVKNMATVTERVTKIIVDKLGVDEAEVVVDAIFTQDLGADSLDTVELIMEFEKEFDLSIPDEQAEKITTVGQAITYLEAQVNA